MGDAGISRSLLVFLSMLLALGQPVFGAAATQPAGRKATSQPVLVDGKEVTHWSGLPLWGAKEARDLGFDLPFPLGVSGNVYSAKENFYLPKVGLGGANGGLLDLGGLSQITKVKVNETAWTTRLDSWVLPFLDVYAIGGLVKGEADVEFGPLMFPVVGQRGPKFDLNLDFEGPTMGLGSTLAAGFKPFKGRPTLLFSMADFNVTRTYVDFKRVVTSLDPVDVAVLSLRLGGRERIARNAKLGDVYLALWGGAMYQGVQEIMSGRLGHYDLNFRANTKSVEPWNNIIGGRLEIGKNFNLTFELGLGDRQSAMLELTYRF